MLAYEALCNFLILSAILTFCVQKDRSEQMVTVTPEEQAYLGENLSEEIENLERDLLEIEKLIAELEDLEKGFET